MQCVNILFLTIFVVVSANKQFPGPPSLYLQNAFFNNQLRNSAPMFNPQNVPYYPMNFPPKPFQIPNRFPPNFMNNFNKFPFTNPNMSPGCIPNIPKPVFPFPPNFPFIIPKQPEIKVPEPVDEIIEELKEIINIPNKITNKPIITSSTVPVIVTTPTNTEFKIETTTNKETEAPTTETTQAPTTTVKTEAPTTVTTQTPTTTIKIFPTVSFENEDENNTEDKTATTSETTIIFKPIEETVNNLSGDVPSSKTSIGSKSENSPSTEDNEIKIRLSSNVVPDSLPNIYGYKPVPIPHNYPVLPQAYMPYGYPPMHAPQMYPGLNPNIPWPPPYYHHN